MAMQTSTAQALPLPPRLSASPSSSPATVGALLTNAAGASRIRRECRSPRSLLSRILGGGGGGGFGCRMRIPRYCSSGAGAAAKEDAVEEEVAAPKVVMASKQETEARESPRSSLQGMKVAPEVSAASLGSEAKSDISSESGSPDCVDIDGVLDDAATECKEHQDNEEEEEGDTDEEDEESKPCHGGVPARVLERRLHELLQSQHEQRIAELETELQRAQRKLRDKEREVSRWRDTAKLVSRHKDESRLR
uniref:Uncharacterized protein n=1 Tax=Aegilops tauschii TaxID=37682 RepID=N1QS99_AEGTA